MQKTDIKYGEYCNILKKELAVAFGCTEPIALAYCAAKAREVLGCLPESARLTVCGNIIKNVKSVIVPNTGKMKGIEASIAAGLAGGRSEDQLEILSHINESERDQIKNLLENIRIAVMSAQCSKQLYIDLTLEKGGQSSRVVIEGAHTNIVLIEKNGETVFLPDTQKDREEIDRAYGLLNVMDIVDFAGSVELSDISEPIKRQIELNGAIAAEGMKNRYGANIGKVMHTSCEYSVMTKAISAPAAGSDARMSGCELPVVIVSGSGNQGMTACLPVIEYAKAANAGEERLVRAVAVADLVTIHQKTGIGRLSAYCGAISAGIGAAAGVAYLLDGDAETVSHTIVNGLAIGSGIVCDGAKPSCAGKIAAAVFSALLGYNMYKQGQQFYAGEGIIAKGVEKCIKNVGRLAKEGMRETDREILQIMTEK